MAREFTCDKPATRGPVSRGPVASRREPACAWLFYINKSTSAGLTHDKVWLTAKSTVALTEAVEA